MKRVPVSGGRAFALVDDADYPRVADRRWYLHSKGYAYRTERTAAGEMTLLMHRVLLGLQPGDGRQGDHENGNGLDNRRSNLRVCSLARNQQNRAPRRFGTSRFRGVTWHKASRKWAAQAKLNYRHRHLGLFDSELDAAIAAETFRQQHMPFAGPDAELLAALAQPEPLAEAA